VARKCDLKVTRTDYGSGDGIPTKTSKHPGLSQADCISWLGGPELSFPQPTKREKVFRNGQFWSIGTLMPAACG
jgi:hypothetical protein